MAQRAKDVDSLVVRWVRWIYIPLIILVIGAMFLHNAIIWRSKAIAKRRMQNPLMTRMTVNQRWQHLILFQASSSWSLLDSRSNSLTRGLPTSWAWASSSAA